MTPRWAAACLAAAAVAAPVLAGCGAAGVAAGDLRAYLASVEPLRLGVNHLLDGADPILDGWREHRMTGGQAAAAMGALEKRFAAYAVDVGALSPPDSTLAGINAPYAHTYVLEDAYLSALVAALPGGDFSTLPNTQSEQRAAIIEWRIRLEMLARSTGVTLPADLQQAGRGEIAPSVTGTS